MEIDVLFAGVAVTDFPAAREWYGRLFGRDADIVAHNEEVMWQASEAGWVYILRDPEHAGNGIVALAVPDLDATIAALGERGVAVETIEQVGDAGRKAVVRDPDRNAIALLEVTTSG